MHLLPTITVPGFPYFSHLIVLVEMWRRGPEVWRSKGLEPVEGSGEGQITCRILDIYHLSNGCPGNTVSATVFSRFMFTDQLPSGREYLSHWDNYFRKPTRVISQYAQLSQARKQFREQTKTSQWLLPGPPEMVEEENLHHLQRRRRPQSTQTTSKT